MKKTLPSTPFNDPQAYLAAIINCSDDAIISKDLKGNITSWNPAAERIFGYSTEEAVGKHISIIIPHERMSEEDYILSQIRQGNRLDHFEAVRRAKDGRELSLSVTVSPIKDKEGNIVGASKVARDVTELKKAERASAYLGAIIESSDDAIISKDLNGFITSWNKSAERIFGYTSDEVVGRHITLIIPSEQLEEEDKILNTLRTGNRIEHYETIRRHKSGYLLPVSLTVSPIRDSKGNIVGASKVSRDISERIKAENALKEMSRKKDEFLANMSHELRTPMNAVIGLASLLKAMPSMPENAKKYIDTLKLSADNMMDLINDLLDFAKIESDLIEIEAIDFDLSEEIEKAVSVVSVKAQEKKLSIHVDYASDLDHSYLGDPLRIQQILMNLLSNAVKFTDSGSIRVNVNGIRQSEDTTSVSISVTDTGIGIPDNKMELIFDKFTQADSSITRRYGGSGLGLAITKALTEKMDGTIQIDSELGIGSTFTVAIPFKNTGQVKKPKSTFQKKASKALLMHKNVLLVEDYEPNVMVACAMLEQLGYDYEVASNGYEALRKFSQGRYDVILMDVQMHELDGMEATRKIRRMEEEKGLKPTPIIALTAHVREQDKKKCLESGMNDFIPKPFEPAQLSKKILQFIAPETNKRVHLKEAS